MSFARVYRSRILGLGFGFSSQILVRYVICVSFVVRLAMEEMGRRFAGSLVLSDREAKGLRIGGRAAQAAARVKFSLFVRL